MWRTAKFPIVSEKNFTFTMPSALVTVTVVFFRMFSDVPSLIPDKPSGAETNVVKADVLLPWLRFSRG